METKKPPGWQAVWMQSAMHDVVDERARQVTQEGWTPRHDNEHVDNELARAAVHYVNHYLERSFFGVGAEQYQEAKVPAGWPWDETWWKPKNPRRDLVRAAALLIAEIERLDRATPPSGGTDNG